MNNETNSNGQQWLSKLGAKTEPWPEPVDGNLLLNELTDLLMRFVVLPKWAAETLALWTLHTYAFQLRDVSTYIGIESPEKRCGKTTLLGVLSQLVHRPVIAANISPPAFFRVIEELQPTLLIDETDTFLQRNDELGGILNAGYRSDTAYVVRVVYRGAEAGKAETGDQKPDGRAEGGLKTFCCWCPKAMAAIGHLPDTLADRCIIIRMQRKKMDETCERLRDLDTAVLKQKCARFVLDHASEIAAARPEPSDTLNDRAVDIWEPLLALADLAGGNWSALARQAAEGLAASAQESNPIGALLLDIWILFNASKAERLLTRTLLDGLIRRSVDRPWAEMRKGKEITDLWLSQQLRPYGIRPRTVRIGETVGRGYAESDFTEAFLRYIPSSEVDALRASRREARAGEEEKAA